MVSEMADHQGDLIKGMFEAAAAGFAENDKKDVIKHGDDHHCWIKMEDINLADDINTSTTSETSSLGEFSRTTSQESTTSSSDLVDDASSSNSSTNSNNNGPLFELSELMTQLPIKRGLSRYFQGKSQSFTSLSSVKSLEDLVKKETPYYRRKMKACKSYGGGLDAHKLYTLPRATISKKVSRNSISSLSFPGRRGSIFSGRPPLIPVQKNFSSV